MRAVDSSRQRSSFSSSSERARGGDLKSRRLEPKLGYGFAAFADRFTLTPEAGLGLSDTGRDMTLGWRLERRPVPGDVGSLELGFEARRRESADSVDTRLMPLRNALHGASCMRVFAPVLESEMG